MNREELAHVLRASARLVGDPAILVIGSQAILGTLDEAELPQEATRSVEADIVFFDDPDETKADAVDGGIGEESRFHETFGYYGQGVTMSTATLPAGWRDRLIPFRRSDADPAEAFCLEHYDIAAAKLVAGREKDYEYVAALIGAGLVDVDVLRERCETLPGAPSVRARVRTWINRQAA